MATYFLNYKSHSQAQTLQIITQFTYLEVPKLATILLNLFSERIDTYLQLHAQFNVEVEWGLGHAFKLEEDCVVRDKTQQDKIATFVPSKRHYHF